jgi:anti-anti-sigma factor
MEAADNLSQGGQKKRRPIMPPPAAADQIQTLVRQQDSVWIIDFIGDLTTFADQQVQSAYGQIPQTCIAFVLNFSQCEYINSAGIAVIISLITQTRRRNQKVLACGLSAHYQKLFYMVGLSDYLQVYASEPEAVEKVAALT